MGCFSFICSECGKPVNSDSFSGENVRLTLLEDGKVLEEMQGQYDSYGRVFDKDGESVEWKKDWNEVCDLMFDSNPRSGVAVAHVACIGPNYKAVENAEGDPEQGWGRYNRKHTANKCETFHKIYNV